VHSDSCDELLVLAADWVFGGGGAQ